MLLFGHDLNLKSLQLCRDHMAGGGAEPDLGHEDLSEEENALVAEEAQDVSEDIGTEDSEEESDDESVGFLDGEMDEVREIKKVPAFPSNPLPETLP